MKLFVFLGDLLSLFGTGSASDHEYDRSMWDKAHMVIVNIEMNDPKCELRARINALSTHK